MLTLFAGGGGGFSGLLDSVTGAYRAYSVRRLTGNYTGSLIRVRESGGDTEADIGYDANGDLDTTALLAHTGANNGFVVTWYDQSGNGLNLTNATDAEQPQIVSSGSVIVDAGGIPTLQFDGTDDYLVNSAGSDGSQPFTTLSVQKTNTAGNDYSIGVSSSGFNPGGVFNKVNAGVLSTQHSTNNSTSNIQIWTVTFNGASTVFRINNDEDTVDAGTNNGGASFAVGATTAGGQDYDGDISEAIFWNSDKSSSHATIESNVNDYYSAF